MDKVALGVRLVLGLIFLVFGLNGFLNFIDPGLKGPALDYILSLVGIKLMMVIKVIEIIVGIAFLSNFYTRVALLFIAPISFNIFWFHLMLEPNGLPIGIVLLAGTGFLLYHNREALSPMLVARPKN